MDTKLLINGEIVDGGGDAVAVLNPATGAEIVGIREATTEQVDAAVAAIMTLLRFRCADTG